jgi:hypothetical protein
LFLSGVVYQASSPDEAALVKAAKHFGYNFKVRKLPLHNTVLRTNSRLLAFALHCK